MSGCELVCRSGYSWGNSSLHAGPWHREVYRETDGYKTETISFLGCTMMVKPEIPMLGLKRLTHGEQGQTRIHESCKRSG